MRSLHWDKMQKKGKWSRWKKSEGVSTCTQSDLDKAHCRSPAQEPPCIYLQRSQSTSCSTSEQACECMSMYVGCNASYTLKKKNVCVHLNMTPNKWRWFNPPGQQWRRKQLHPCCPPIVLRSTAALEKGRQGNVGQADLCARCVKRSEWAKGTGRVRALLLTAGEEEAPWTQGLRLNGANSTCCL